MSRTFRPSPVRSVVRSKLRAAIAFIVVAVLPHKSDGDGNAGPKAIRRFEREGNSSGRTIETAGS